ncbi:MAG: DNA-binding transcriptional LysR family regulator, partial [Myxococcota bacterium]
MASRFEALELFIAVVDHDGFSSAARALGVSKSHVSKQITALEDRLGARLLNRTTRQQTLTDSGRTLYERARQVLADLQEAEQTVSQLQDCPRGTLRLSVPMSFGLAYLAQPIAVFMARHPRLDIEATLADRRVNLLDEGYDLAVRSGQLDDSSLIARKLAKYRMLAVASPAYLSEHGRPSAPDDLAAHAKLLYAYQYGGRSWTFRTSGAEHGVRVDGRLVANNGEVLLA